MKHLRLVLIIGLLALSNNVFAGPHASMGLEGTPGSDKLAAWVEKNGETAWADLSIAEMVSLDQAKSVLKQEMHYVYGAAVSSYMLPGLGQFKAGDALGGSLHLAGQVALVGGTAWGVWSLLPADLKAGTLTHEELHTRIQTYFKEDFATIAPAFGVMTGGMVLSAIHSVWAASDAKNQALDKVKNGKVSFEPVALGLGFGLRMKL